MRMPHGGQWDLTARTIKARPAQGTPWWSASGAAPSKRSSAHPGSCAHLDRCPHKQSLKTARGSNSFQFHRERHQHVAKPLKAQSLKWRPKAPSQDIAHKSRRGLKPKGLSLSQRATERCGGANPKVHCPLCARTGVSPSGIGRYCVNLPLAA